MLKQCSRHFKNQQGNAGKWNCWDCPCCKAKSCSDGRGAPKAPRCPFCAWARTGWGDWIRLNKCGYVVISRVDRFEVVKTLVLGDCPHTPWAFCKGYKQGRPLFLYSSVENLIQSLGTSPTLVMEGPSHRGGTPDPLWCFQSGRQLLQELHCHFEGFGHKNNYVLIWVMAKSVDLWCARGVHHE